jgi:hypothetical protein
MSWHNLALNPDAIASLFSDVPSLENIELFSLTTNRDGPNVIATIELARYPDRPSQRWSSEFHSVQVRLNFIAISDFKARGLHTEMNVDITIKRDSNNGLKVCFVGRHNDIDISFNSRFFRIDRVTPYFVP